ncbi:MAG: hypothetical protein HQK54_05955 [Oligoflexales bacterium]|nr:hypothetical protein [Oligoflexales bacterium]
MYELQNILNGYSKLGSQGIKYCDSNICNFTLKGEIGHKFFTLFFEIDPSLVRNGFYPLLFSNSSEIEDKLGYKISSFNHNDRMGVYFETSGLPKGSHEWRLWIRLDEDDEMTVNESCPPLVVPAKTIRINQT